MYLAKQLPAKAGWVEYTERCEAGWQSQQRLMQVREYMVQPLVVSTLAKQACTVAKLAGWYYLRCGFALL